jgi:pimeloyl-ACP methyl ester carboxylesterase
VLVHGLVVSSSYMRPLAEILSGETGVYAPDLPGYGKSEAGTWGTDVSSLATALDRWMDVVGLEQAVVIANSFGCQIAARLAAAYPNRVRELVLLGPVVEPAARNLAVLAARGLMNAFTEPASLGPIIARDFLAMGPSRALALLQSMLTDRIEDTVQSIAAPTLVVRGQRDTLVSKRWARMLVGLLSFGQLVEISGAGHALNYNAPETVAALVRSSLKETRDVPRAS